MRTITPFLFLLMLFIPEVSAADVTAFASPDSSFQAVSGFISGAQDSLLIAVYTFTSPEIMDMLIEKKEKGLEVEIIVDKSPAGGMEKSEEAILCTLLDNNIPVLLYEGPLNYMHAKYMLRDSSAVLLTSENFGYAGFHPEGEYGNRGWGAIVHDTGIYNGLRGIYLEDRKGSKPFTCKLKDYTVSKWRTAGAYQKRFAKEDFKGQEVEIITSPDSLERLLRFINSANSSIMVQQFYIYRHWGPAKANATDAEPDPLLEALISRARNGVAVKVLLDSADYNMDEARGTSNHYTIEYINSVAEKERIPIEAKPIDLKKKGLVIAHNKGMVIDGKAALVSSINWNKNSVMENREAGLIITGDAAGYYSGIFLDDWDGQDGKQGLGFWPAMISLAALLMIIIYFMRRKNKHAVEL